MNDPYSVLGITPGADEETIKKAYRQKCKQYHPDLHPDDPTCEDKFKDVQAAYSEVMRMRSGGLPLRGDALSAFRRRVQCIQQRLFQLLWAAQQRQQPTAVPGSVWLWVRV